MLLLFAATIAIPLGLDLYLPVPEDNPLTSKRSNWGGGCSSTAAFRATGRSPARRATIRSAPSPTGEVAVGVFGRRGRRNSPALINRGYGRSFFWDGRVTTLEEQVLKPIEDPNEMDLTLPEAAARVNLHWKRSRALSPASSARYCRAIRRSTASSTATAPRSRTTRSAGCRSFAARATASPVTSVRTSPTSVCTTRASPGATAVFRTKAGSR